MQHSIHDRFARWPFRTSNNAVPQHHLRDQPTGHLAYSEGHQLDAHSDPTICSHPRRREFGSDVWLPAPVVIAPPGNRKVRRSVYMAAHVG